MTQFSLKLIAMLAMLLDHTAKVLLSHGVLTPLLGIENSRTLCVGMMVLGRAAFPIFAWFAAEGCRRTTDAGRHLLRLLIFALLSEIPFQLCFSDGLEPGCHNVIFTFLLASAAIFCGERIRTLPLPVRLIPPVIAVVLGWVLYTDYNAWGVALVLMLYYLPTESGRLLLLAAWVTVFQLLWHGWNGQSLSWLTASGSLQLLYWLGGMTSVGLLATYNGARGGGSKWLFYGFYPCHLLLLYGIAGIIL